MKNKIVTLLKKIGLFLLAMLNIISLHTFIFTNDKSGTNVSVVKNITSDVLSKPINRVLVNIDTTVELTDGDLLRYGKPNYDYSQIFGISQKNYASFDNTDEDEIFVSNLIKHETHPEFSMMGLRFTNATGITDLDQGGIVINERYAQKMALHYGFSNEIDVLGMEIMVNNEEYTISAIYNGSRQDLDDKKTNYMFKVAYGDVFFVLNETFQKNFEQDFLGFTLGEDETKNLYNYKLLSVLLNGSFKLTPDMKYSSRIKNYYNVIDDFYNSTLIMVLRISAAIVFISQLSLFLLNYKKLVNYVLLNKLNVDFFAYSIVVLYFNLAAVISILQPKVIMKGIIINQVLSFNSLVSSLFYIALIYFIFKLLLKNNNVISQLMSIDRGLDSSTDDKLIIDSSTDDKSIIDSVELSNTNKKNIIMIGQINYPFDTAGGLRCKVFADEFLTKGFNVAFISYSTLPTLKLSKENEMYFIPFSKKLNQFNRIQKIKTMMFQTKPIKKALLIAKNYFSNIKTIYIYSTINFSTYLMIKDFCKENGIELIIDVVEKLTPTNRLSSYLPNLLIHKNLIKSNDKLKVIVISSYLEKMYSKNKNLQVIQIPFVMKKQLLLNKEKFENKKMSTKIKIVYIGNPGKKGEKDCIKEIVKGFLLLTKDEKNFFEIHFYGFKLMDAFNMGLTLEDLNSSTENCFFHGKLDRQNVQNVYDSSDFSILLRDSKREQSKAGFPTKITESMFFGVPPITNLTSDLEQILEDEVNSVIIWGDNSFSVKEAFKKIISMNLNKKGMQKKVFETFNNHLDISHYSDVIDQLSN